MSTCAYGIGYQCPILFRRLHKPSTKCFCEWDNWLRASSLEKQWLSKTLSRPDSLWPLWTLWPWALGLKLTIFSVANFYSFFCWLLFENLLKYPYVYQQVNDKPPAGAGFSGEPHVKTLIFSPSINSGGCIVVLSPQVYPGGSATLLNLPKMNKKRQKMVNQKRAIMQNKPNFRNDEMNVNKVLTKGYENICPRRPSQNKPNSNPIKANQTQFQTFCRQEYSWKQHSKSSQSSHSGRKLPLQFSTIPILDKAKSYLTGSAGSICLKLSVISNAVDKEIPLRS